MATLRFLLGEYGHSQHDVIGSAVQKAGEHTTSGTASFVEASATDIEAKPGQVFRARSDGAVWLAFGGKTAVVGTDHYVPADETVDIGVMQAGKISVIDDS